jgi:hypothetical protein
MTIRLLGCIVLGIIFLSFASFSLGSLMRWKVKNDFLCSARELSDRINTIADQDAGSSFSMRMRIPNGCTLLVENRLVIAYTWGDDFSFEVRQNVPKILLSEGEYQVTLHKGENGVDILVI